MHIFTKMLLYDYSIIPNTNTTKCIKNRKFQKTNKHENHTPTMVMCMTLLSFFQITKLPNPFHPMPICIKLILIWSYSSRCICLSDWTLRFVHLDLVIGYFNLIILIALSFCLVCFFFCFDCLV